MAKKKKEDFGKERRIIAQIIDREVGTSKSNTQNRVGEFELAVDLLECERTERNADWMSDIFIPEFAAQMLTQSSVEASQYFQTRDFVEVYLEDEDPIALARADANKELINRTLNQRYLRHYQKFMRSNIIKNVGGEVYIQCGWERRTKIQNMPTKRVVRSENYDVNGNALVDRTIQEPAYEEITEMQPKEVMDIDRFNYEVIDRRNLFMSNEYCYSIQDKRYVIIREEKTLNQLGADAEQEGYINLDKLKDMKPDIETETSKESYNKDQPEQKVEIRGYMPFDIYHRYGKYWAIVNQRDDYENPVDIEIGINDFGEPKEGAELVECIISILVSGSSRQLIRFIPLPFIDAMNRPYRPLIRGLCYIHPTKDHGLGDGKFCRELQVGINDTFNISNDRVMLSTLPTLKGKKYALEDNPTVYFEPGHPIMLDNPDDLVEFKITDNIAGAMGQIAQLKQFMSGVTSIFPPQLGGLPELASTTATAVVGAEQNKSVRANYKALTFEHTFLNELYWMITQMTWQFATEETAYKLMGKKAMDFDPTAEFTYKPLSQSIESEYSKANQIKSLSQLIGFIAPTTAVNPKAARLINFMLSKVFKLYGDEYAAFGSMLLDESAPVVPGQQTGGGGMPVSNQNNVPMSGMESSMRGMANMEG